MFKRMSEKAVLLGCLVTSTLLGSLALTMLVHAATL